MGRKLRKPTQESNHTSGSKQRQIKTTEHTVIQRHSTPKKDYQTNIEDEIFDILPKTDYTYARTGSYSPRFLGRKWVNPNMSRYRVRSRHTRRVIGDGEFEESEEEYVEYSDEEKEPDMDVVSTNSSVTGTPYRTVVEDGMLLRSGQSLHSIRSMLDQQEDSRRTRRSIATDSMSSSKPAVSQTMSEPRVNQYTSSRSEISDLNLNRNARTSKKKLSYTQTRSVRSSNINSYSNRDENIRKGKLQSCLSDVDEQSLNANHKAKKTIIQRVEEETDGANGGLEKGETELSEKSSRTRGRTAQQRSHSIGRGYGLDSDSEFSDTNTSNNKPVPSSSSCSICSSEGSSSSISSSCVSVITTTTTTVITTVSEKIKPVWREIGEPICRPFRKYIGKPLWRYVGRPLWRTLGRPIVSTILAVLGFLWFSVCDPILCTIEKVVVKVVKLAIDVTESIFMVPFTMWKRSETGFTKFLVADVRHMKRRRRRTCCMCLPLLLLLPIVLGMLIGSDVWRKPSVVLNRSRFAFGAWWASNVSPDVKLQTDSWYLSQINEEVQKIQAQLEQTDRSQLSVEQVQQIVRGMLATELHTLKVNMNGAHNRLQLNQDETKAVMEKQLGDMNDEQANLELNIKNLKIAIEKQKVHLTEQGEQNKAESAAKLAHLEKQLSTLITQMVELEKGQAALLKRVNECCRNEAMYKDFIKEQVAIYVAQLLIDQAEDDPLHNAFSEWLHRNYVSRDDLDKRLTSLSEELTNSVMTIVKARESKQMQEGGSFFSGFGSSDSVSEQQVRMMIEESLFRYSADKTGLPDFALESAGGTVVSTRCSETYYRRTALVSVMGIPLWYTSNSPRTVIQPEVHPGQCWAFRGSQGYLVIQTSTTIIPSGFTVEHIPKTLAPTGEIDSAPKEFSVLGLLSEYDSNGVTIGNYTYLDEGNPVQYFAIQLSYPEAYHLFELKIHSNYGNIEYTCLYRFRIHGKPIPT